MTKHVQVSAIPLLIVPFLVLLCSAQERVLVVGDEELNFTPAPERGYVVKLRPDSGDIKSLGRPSGLDMAQARPIRGLDRRGIWTVENDGPSTKNEQNIAKMSKQSHVAYVAPLFSSNGETVAIIPEIVVRAKPGIEADVVQKLCEAARCTIRKRMDFTTQEYLLDVLGPDAEAVFAAVEQFSEASEIEWACPNTAFRPKLCGQSSSAVSAPGGQQRIVSAVEDPNSHSIFPNDEYFPMQWHVHNTGQSGGTLDADINAPEAWGITVGDPNIIIAVVDTGVDTNHPDLVTNLVPGYDFWEDDELPDPAVDEPENAHGTLCAGLAGARGNNVIGVTGVTWNCKIMPIRTMHTDANGVSNETEADVAEAFRWGASHGADILNNSWSWGTSPTPIIHSAIVDITSADGMGRDGKGCIVLFAAGNNGEGLRYPQKYTEVIAIGATDHNDLRCSYGNFGPELDVVAPSAWQSTDAEYISSKCRGAVWTTDIAGVPGYSEWNSESGIAPDMLDYSAAGGTSMACPIVAGVAALILSVEPELANVKVRHFLERSAKDLGDPGWDEYYGWGRLDARAALDMVLAKRADLNSDWVVDEEDEAILVQAMDANDLLADIAPAAKRDGVVDANDLELLTQYLGAVIPELGLIAHWKLDETEGMVVHDSAGRHHDATVMGVPLWQPEGGMLGGALYLDGVDAYVETPPVLNPADGPLSVFAWIKGGAADQVVLSQSGGMDWLLIDATGALMTNLRG